jgi:probable rRNA maturation factor
MKPVLLNNDTNLSIPDVTQFNQWVSQVIAYHGSFFQISIQIVDKKTSQQLNNTYRAQDKPTNVLSFALELPAVVKEDLIGDLAICAEIVAEQAQQQNKPISHHWAHLTIHGVLHLLGYDHINDEEAEEMEALEIKLLAKLDIANPYD